MQQEENDNSGKVEECLKEAFLDGRISDRACRLEVAGLIEEAKADIHVDPILSRACSLDITKYCIDVPHGNSRGNMGRVGRRRISAPVSSQPEELANYCACFSVLQCLQTVMASSRQKLQTDCESKLSQRMEMFRNAEPLVSV